MGFGSGFKKIFGNDKQKEKKGSDNSKNFKHLDDLIHSGVKEIVLDSDIVLDNAEKSTYSKGIELDVDDVVIDGNGHYIDARGKTRIFECTGKNITLKNIRLTNGLANAGGAIHMDNGELTIAGLTFDKNKSNRGVGGAISTHNSDLTIIESIFNENFSKEDGGAIEFGRGELTIIDSTFNENFAKDGGGAIFSSGNSNIKNSVFTKNASKDTGGQYPICLVKWILQNLHSLATPPSGREQYSVRFPNIKMQ